ncbi:MAG: hypothetical protein ACI9YL_002195 [Luteibaculaceae bacterium]|jgi:hypothetical protein
MNKSEVRCNKCQNWSENRTTCLSCGNSFYTAPVLSKISKKDFRIIPHIKKSIPFKNVGKETILMRFLKGFVNVAFLIYFSILSAFLWILFWLPG